MDQRRAFLEGMLGKTVHVEIDRPIGYDHNGILYPVNYGFLPGIFAADGEEQDAYVLGVTEPISSFDGQVIGAVCRKDDCEDKLVVAPAGTVLHQAQIAEAVHFQEQFFDTYIVCLLRKSCGVLPWRQVGNAREYLIVFEQFSQCWSLPKGHMEIGETEEETALRELIEETGLTARLEGEKRATIEYPISPMGRKQVVFFSGQVSGEPTVRHGEIDSFRWVKAEYLKDYLFPDTVAACESLIN